MVVHFINHMIHIPAVKSHCTAVSLTVMAKSHCLTVALGNLTVNLVIPKLIHAFIKISEFQSDWTYCSVSLTFSLFSCFLGVATTFIKHHP